MSKTTVRKGKQDDKFSLAIREIQVNTPANKQCFDCEQRGPTYINMTIGSFVCTKCSGMLRGINPPHRIKSISMSSFTSDEVELMRSKGNLWCAAVWLGLYDKASHPVDFKDEEKIKEFIISKYEKKRYYIEPSPSTLAKVSDVSTVSSSSSQKSNISSLIGSTLKARVDSTSSISVSRPATIPGPVKQSVPPPLVVAVANITTTNGHHPMPTPTVPPPAKAVEPQPLQQPPPQQGFANFADFDSQAFESLPPDPLTAPPLPLYASQPITSDRNKKMEQSVQDRYSALKELDDLFKTTTVEDSSSSGAGYGPDANSAANAFPEIGSASIFPDIGSASVFPDVGSASVFPDIGISMFPEKNVASVFPDHGAASVFSEQPFGNGLFSQATVPTSSVPAFPASHQDLQHNGSPAWPTTTGWGGRSTSPMATTGWGGPTPSTTMNWGSKETTPAWPSTDNLTHSTNPFGSSPSNPSAGHFYTSENNNDLFAAAPKPFISDKPAVGLDGTNPWLGVPAFTADMKPAPNPNNPFL